MPYTPDGLSGWKAGETSRISAEAAAPKGEALISEIRKFMHRQVLPQTADEICAGMKMDPLSIRPRLTVMKNRNLIRDSGSTKLSDRGKQMTAWELN